MSRIADKVKEQHTLQKDQADRDNASTPGLAMARARKLEVTGAWVYKNGQWLWLKQ